ncbi:hypothetical protein [Kiloniella sp. b19]|uniref:hypothetical protein n=1 Tax=Kiloniella sp. GXU_MW_B19 TaxID=3141326 RepID=UPI0031D7E77F
MSTKKTSRYKTSHRILGVAGAAASLSWLWACYTYIERQMGWPAVQSLLPHEQALIVSGVVLPLLLLWCWLLFYGRGMALSDEAQEFLRRMDMLTYPDDEDAKRVRAITDQLKEQADDLTNAARFAEERVGSLVKTFGSHSESLSDLTVEAARNAEQIHETMQKQEESLDRANAAFEQALERSQQSVNTQVQALEGAGARSEAMADTIAGTINRATSDLDKAVQRAIDRTEEASDLLKQHAEDMAAAGTTAEVSCEAMRNSLQQDLELMTQVQERVNEEVERHKKLIQTRMADVEAVLAGTGDKLDQLRERLGEENRAMEGLVGDLGAKADGFTSALQSEVKSVHQVFEDNTQHARELAASFRTESNALGDQAQRIEENLRSVTRNLAEAVAIAGQDEASRLTEATAQAQETLLRASQSISPSIESLQEGSERLNDLADVIMGGVAEHTREINRVYNEARGSLAEYNQGIQEQAQLIENTAEKAMRHTTEVTKVYQIQTAALAEGANAASVAVRDLRQGVFEEIDAFRSLTDDYKALLEDTRQTVDSRVQLLRESSRDARDSGDRLRRELDNQRKRLEQMTGETLERIGSMGERADKVIASLDSTAAGALMKSAELLTSLQNQSDIMTSAVETAQSATSRLVAELDQRSKDVRHVTEAALRQSLSLREDTESNKRDQFLRSATLLIEDINSSAVELNRLLDEEIPEEYWKRYQRGERGIFARNILRKKDQFTIPAIKKNFESNRDFRNAVNRYVDQFDSLMEQARDCDSNDVLAATFMTADVGKLYILLSRSLGRME